MYVLGYLLQSYEKQMLHLKHIYTALASSFSQMFIQNTFMKWCSD